MSLKLLDKIKERLRKNDIYIQNPIRSPLKKGKVSVFEPYDLEKSRLEEAEEKEKNNSLPHKI